MSEPLQATIDRLARLTFALATDFDYDVDDALRLAARGYGARCQTAHTFHVSKVSR